MSRSTFQQSSINSVVRRYVSEVITQADLVGGAATQAITLTPAFPANAIPVGAYLVTSRTTTSSDAGTTGLTAEIGPAADPNGYAVSASIFGAAGRKQTATTGAMIGCLRTADAPQIALTATGGSADLADISALSVQAVIFYIAVTGE